MVICKLCNRELESLKSLGLHIRHSHKDYTLQNYYDEFIQGRKTCLSCGEETEFKSLKDGYRKFHKHCMNSDEAKRYTSLATTLAGCIEKYGNVEGRLFWEERQRKCKPGLDALIKRHGEEKGKEIFEKANNKRKQANSKKGLIQNHGEEKALEIFRSFGKDYRKDELIEEFGERLGKKKFRKLYKEKSKRCKEYWIKLGFSGDEAKEKVSEYQITFSLEKCIEKYGEDEGKKVWEERQEKWLRTMSSKSVEEKENIIKKRMKGLRHGSISKPEVELKNALQCNSQIHISNYVFDLGFDKNLIEFNGNYWHCNPKTYHENYFHRHKKKLAKDIWLEDKNKIEFAISIGYDVLVIWEDEYKKDKQAVIEKSRNFLYGI